MTVFSTGKYKCALCLMKEGFSYHPMILVKGKGISELKICPSYSEKSTYNPTVLLKGKCIIEGKSISEEV